MSTIIRDVLIRVAVENVPTQVQIPNLDPLVSVTDKLDKGVQRTVDSVEELAKAVGELRGRLEDVDKSSPEETIASTGEAARLTSEHVERLLGGVMQLTRGIVLTSGATEENIQTTLKMLSVVQGAKDTFEGTSKTVQGLAVAFGASAEQAKSLGLQSGLAAAGLQSLLSVISYLEAQDAKTAQATRDLIAANSEYQESILGITADQQMQLAMAEEGSARMESLSSALTESNERQADSTNRLKQAYVDFYTQANQSGGDLGDMRGVESVMKSQVEELQRQKQIHQEINQEQERGFDLAKKELDTKRESLQTATDLLKKEQDRMDSIAASLGNLTASQTAQLDDILTRKERGETLTKRDAQKLQKFGQNELATDVYEELGKQNPLYDKLARARGGEDRTIPLTDARDKAREGLGVKDGETPEQAVTRQMEELNKQREERIKEQNAILKDLITKEAEARKELEKLRKAMAENRVP